MRPLSWHLWDHPPWNSEDITKSGLPRPVSTLSWGQDCNCSCSLRCPLAPLIGIHIILGVRTMV